MRVRIHYRQEQTHPTDLDAVRVLWDDQQLRIERSDHAPFTVLTGILRSVALVDVEDEAEQALAVLQKLATLRDAIPQTR